VAADRNRTGAARVAALGSSALVLLVALAAASCRPAASDPRPNLVLIVIDNLRADHLGAYGYPRATSPQLDRLAAGGVVFENAVATSSWTKPSVASLFTSRHPSEHNAVSFARHLAPELPTLAEILRDAGYRTLGVTANFVHVNERWGFARGFDAWKSFSVEVADESEVLWRYEHQPGAFVPLRAPNGAEVNREVLERLDAADDRPAFLYVHYMEPHAPYTPRAEHLTALIGTDSPEAGAFATNDYLVQIARGEVDVPPARRQWLIDLYDAEIAGVDQALGDLLAELRRRDVLANAVVAVVSDHGEEFAEHGGWFHGITLHRESLAVPLVLRDFRSDASGERVAEAVDLADVPTTLLALAGAATPAGLRGRDLLAEGPLPPRDLVAELHADPRIEEHIRPRTHRFALTHWPWKAIVARDRSRHVYRADRDAAESAPVTDPGEVPDDVREAVAALTRELDALTPDAPESLDAEAIEGLRALGYTE
jgi:arylsulfatase A-like enzyme